MPGVTTATSSKYDQIPGPLGLASASLEGKVALVTGAGTYIFCYLDFSKLGLHPQFGLHKPARTGRQFYPNSCPAGNLAHHHGPHPCMLAPDH